METLGEIVRIAAILGEKLGRGAPEILDSRADGHDAEGDDAGAAFWRRVAKVIRETTPYDQEYMRPSRKPQKFVLGNKQFARAFAQSQQPTLLLQPNLVIAAVNEAYLEATMLRGRDIIGCSAFDVFPPHLATGGAASKATLEYAFARVLESDRAGKLASLRYDIRNHDGAFEEHWWNTTLSPVHDDDGRITLIQQQTSDVTANRVVTRELN